MRGQDKNICYPGEGRVISDDAREANLFVTVVNTERQRILDRSLNDFTRAARRPVRFTAEIVMNQIEIETRAVGAYGVIVAMPGVCHNVSEPGAVATGSWALGVIWPGRYSFRF